MERSDLKKFVDMPLDELVQKADMARREGIGAYLETCGIINAKSGTCGENCKFCAQSVHNSTDIEIYPLKDKDSIVSKAREAKSNGAKRFSIVTSGNRLTFDELDVVCGAISEMIDSVGIFPCASLGALDKGAFMALKAAGLKRYHHNLETSERFYSEIVSTHKYSERVNTVKTAKGCGFEVCSGGILGMGETWDDRIDMALLLRELDVESVPINFLVPIKGTPMEKTPAINPLDAIRAIAIFRLALPEKTIKVVAGRESVLRDFQEMIFTAGANGMLVGGYLTTQGRAVEEDIVLVNKIEKLWKSELKI